MAGGADIILIPEIPYSIDSVVAKIDHRANSTLSRPFSSGVRISLKGWRLEPRKVPPQRLRS